WRGGGAQPAQAQPPPPPTPDAPIAPIHGFVPVAEPLAPLPATSRSPTPTAGLTFTLPRSITPISDTRLLRIIAERADEITKASSAILAGRADLANVPGELAQIAAALVNATVPVPRAPSGAAQGTVD